MLAVLGLAIWNYTLPLLEVKVPPLVSKQITAWNLTQPVLKSLTKEKKESALDKLKGDTSFYDVLEKIVPKNEETGKKKKFSLTFIMGVFVPIAIIASYLILFIVGIVFLLGRVKVMTLFAAISVVLSTYALAGTYYLGKAAQEKFQNTVEEKSAGLLGAVAKHFVSEITIKPDMALYILFGLALTSWALNAIASAGKK